MKKTISVALAFLMLFCCLSLTASAEDETPSAAPTGFNVTQALYVHAVTGSADGEAWQAWQNPHDRDMNDLGGSSKYFFLPVSADDSQADIYNGYPSDVTVNGTLIPTGETRAVSYEGGKAYSVSAGGVSYSLTFMKSSAEAAVYVNNPDADGAGTDLLSYLSADKENKATATSAIVSADGKIDNTAIKKIKGRGNTSWGKPKKGFNITYDKKVSVGGMEKNKKYSLIANYQDDSISRNRFLYDLSDAVKMPYASDSRFVDFYVNGYYAGSYLMAEKVEAGSLVTDVSDTDYLNKDGTIKSEFKFIAEVDASAGEGDYYFTCDNGVKITIKSPELEPADAGYDEVREFIRGRCNELMSAAKSFDPSLSDIIDVDSCAKLYLINELGKNWDSGVSSTFFTYKPDKSGNYKFFGSPVWDYDNSLGNAAGVSSELRNIGVSDYTAYSGWWCRFKGKSSGSSTSDNIINNFARNPEIQAASARIWFEEFMPAINHFSGKTYNELISDELYPAYTYFTLAKDSAEMNYKSGWPTNGAPSWVAEHTSLKNAEFNFYTGTYSVSSKTTSYKQNFEGYFRYAKDWMLSRAAWLSNQMYSDYSGSKVQYDADRSGSFDINDLTQIQRFLAEFEEMDPLTFELSDVNLDGKVNIRDVTFLQYIKAGYDVSGYVTERPDPWSEEDTPVEAKTTFVDDLGWGEIYVYYYGSGNYSLKWPGVPMTEIGENTYTAEIPDYVEYLIFTTADGSVQTEKIPYDGKTHTYRALSQTYANGRHYYEIS